MIIIISSWGVPVLLNCVPVHTRLDCFSHRITMEGVDTYSVQNSQNSPNRGQPCTPLALKYRWLVKGVKSMRRL